MQRRECKDQKSFELLLDGVFLAREEWHLPEQKQESDREEFQLSLSVHPHKKDVFRSHTTVTKN